MKNILKILIFALSIFVIQSCTNERDPVVKANDFTATPDASAVSPTVLSDATKANVFAKLTWGAVNNGVPSASTYTIIISDKDADPEFKNAAEYNGTGVVFDVISGTATLTVNEMNMLMSRLPSFKCSEMNIELRVKSKLGTTASSAFYQYSNPINFKVTGYSIKSPVLSLVIAGGTAENSVKIKSSNFQTFTDYDGYAFLEAGNYQFYKPDPCGDFTGATILGGETVVGSGSMIGGNVWLVESVPENSKVYHKSQIHISNSGDKK